MFKIMCRVAKQCVSLLFKLLRILLSIKRLCFSAASIFVLYLACNLNADSFGLRQRDIQPPVLLEQHSFEDRFVLKFNEDIAQAEFGQLSPAIPLQSLQFSGSQLTVQLGEKTLPGTPYLLRAQVGDSNGNILNFLVRLHGKNESPARLLINELNPEGSKSSNSPEIVEFFVVNDGNIGGILFTIGTVQENKGSFIFPPMQVATGDFILLHTRWDPEHARDIFKVNETEDQTQAQARLSSDSAWDFWADEITGGLSDTNAALTLYASPEPQAEVMDAIIYSTSFTAERYRGWKSSFLQRQVDRLSELGAWLGAADAGAPLVPEDAIRSVDSTGTRSLSRRHQAGQPIDTNSAADWIIVPTSGYTFGSVNSEEEYAK